MRIVAECLGLESACNKAMVFQEVRDVNATASKLVKGLREGGYTRPQEIDHMIVKGPVVSTRLVMFCDDETCFGLEYEISCDFVFVFFHLLLFWTDSFSHKHATPKSLNSNSQAYGLAIEDYKTRTPAVTAQDEWLAEKQKELDESAAERKQRIKEDYEEAKTKEIEDIAREWAKREYFRKATSGDMPYSENEYIKSVWERALFEGDLKYRMLHGQETDERKELAEFKQKQGKKKAMMLERAKAALNEALGEDDMLVPAGDDDDKE